MTQQELMCALQSAQRDYHREWCEWLLTLTAWERHYAFRHELVWYDDFVAGEIDLDTLTTIVISQFEEHSIKA